MQFFSSKGSRQWILEVGPWTYLKRAAFLKMAKWLGMDPVVLPLPNGIDLLLPLGSGFSTHAYVSAANCDWTSEYILESYLRHKKTPQGVFCDIGAHFGYYSAVCGPTAAITYSFEPDPRNFENLKRNLDQIPGARHINKALSDKAGTFHLNVGFSSTDSRLQTSQPTGKNLIEVATTTLDAFFEERPEEKLLAAKIDVEGQDMAVVRGAARLMQTQRPAFLVEFNAGDGGVNTVEGLASVLKEFDYQLHAVTRPTTFTPNRVSEFRQVDPEELGTIRTHMLFLAPSEETFFHQRAGFLVDR